MNMYLQIHNMLCPQGEKTSYHHTTVEEKQGPSSKTIFQPDPLLNQVEYFQAEWPWM